MTSPFRHTVPEPRFMVDGGLRLFSSLHRATGESPSSMGVVICPALTDEHIASYRIVYQLALRLSSAGIAVLRFDPPGHGDSEGELADSTPERIASAATVGAQRVREETGATRVGFLGVRMGCAGALSAAQQAADSFCVAWAPLLSAEQYFRAMLRRQILSDVMYGGARRSVDALISELTDSAETTEGIDIGGYLLTGALYDAYCRTNFPERLAKATSPLLVAQRETPSAGTPRPLLDRLSTTLDNYHASNAEVFWNFPHVGSVPPSPDDWIEVTQNWILEQALEALGKT